METTPLIRPVIEPASVTSPYGRRIDPITGQPGAWHPGIDYIHKDDTGGDWPGDRSVVAVCYAQVMIVQNEDYNPAERWNRQSRHSLGRFVYLSALIHGKRYFILHAHLDSVAVRVGQRLDQGSPVGVYGTTGASTGPHLHFGMFDRAWAEANVFEIMKTGLNARGLALI